MKNIIRQPRPISKDKEDKRGYGMPSSHSQAIAFFTAYIHCALLSDTSNRVGIYYTLCFHLFSAAVIWSRVKLEHHTKSQVLAGTVLGVVCALIWYRLWLGYFNHSKWHSLFDSTVQKMTAYLES